MYFKVIFKYIPLALTPEHTDKSCNAPFSTPVDSGLPSAEDCYRLPKVKHVL